jgi:RHS repeat-associated protein
MDSAMTPVLTVAYDANGNTLADASGKSYTWDFENRLMQAVVPGPGTTTFKYDPFGRRIQKSGPLGTTNYLYDGPSLMEEADQSGNFVASYSQGANIDEPLAEFRSATASYYEADGVGTITSISNSSGAIAETYTYDSFGKPNSSTGTLTNPFRYTAREFDSETAVYSYRARYFDPSIGRFLSQDPGEEGSLFDALNLYRYVQNNPINYADPLGLYTLKPSNPPLPPPSAALDALLKCIEANTHINLIVTSTSEPPPLSTHGPNDPHRRDGGLAVDVHYPSDPDAVLNAAACCGAKNALDEKKHPSKYATAAHLHLQLVPGPNPNNPGGNLPKNPKCKECQQ